MNSVDSTVFVEKHCKKLFVSFPEFAEFTESSVLFFENSNGPPTGSWSTEHTQHTWGRILLTDALLIKIIAKPDLENHKHRENCMKILYP